MSLSGILALKGAPVTFSRTVDGSYEPATDTSTAPTTTTVIGAAMQIAGDPELYKNLELIESDNPTLLFQPATLGEMPALGASVTWGGIVLTVRNINKLAMNGAAGAARILVGR